MGGNLSLERTSYEEVNGLRHICVDNDAAFTVRLEVFKFTPTIDPDDPSRVFLLGQRENYDIDQCNGFGRISGGLGLHCIDLADCRIDDDDGFAGSSALRWGYSITQVDVPRAGSVSQEYRTGQYNYDPNGHRLELTCTGANSNGFCRTSILPPLI